MERDLSIYPSIFLSVFVVYRLLLGISYCIWYILYIFILLCFLFYLCWLFWFSSQYLPSDWLERLHDDAFVC